MCEIDIRNYAQLMAECGLTGLEFRTAGDTVRMERNATAIPVSMPVVHPAPVAAPAAEVPSADTISITSPMVGVFYRAPAENADPFVKVGDRVKKGDTVGIIEAMKLMNEVIADTDGVVEEICIENAQTVDFGCVLMRIRP